MGTDNVTLIEFAFVVGDNIGARSHMRRDENIRPIIGPFRVVFVVIGRRRYLLHLLWILFFPHYTYTLHSSI